MTQSSTNLIYRLKRINNFYLLLLGRKKIINMALSTFLVSALELGGLVVLFPYLKFITDQQYYNPIMYKLSAIWPSPISRDHFNMVCAISLVLCVFFVFKAIIYTALIRYQARIGGQVNSKSTELLIQGALYSRYQLFLDVGAVKIAGISNSNTGHASMIFQYLVAASNEIIFLSITFISILIIAPAITLFVILFVSALSLFVFYPLSKITTQLGLSHRDYEERRYKFNYAFVKAIRDIKIMGLEQQFMNLNSEIIDGFVSVYSKYQTNTAFMRILIEAIMLCSIILSCVLLLAWNFNLVEYAALLATIGLISVRAAPAFSRLVGYFNGIKMSLPLVEDLLDCNDLLIYYKQEKTLNFQQKFGDYKAVGLCFGYGNRLVVDHADICIKHNKVTVIVGSSGAGKSTLLDLLAGLQKPVDGTFELNGHKFSPFECIEFGHKIGYVSQSISLLDATIEYNICLEREPDIPRLKNAIVRAHISEFIDYLPDGLKTMLGDGYAGLSGGQIQRLGIARALYRNPALLILDEVTSSLDEQTSKSVLSDLCSLKEDVTLLFVTHDLRWIEADYIYQMNQGKLSLMLNN